MLFFPLTVIHLLSNLFFYYKYHESKTSHLKNMQWLFSVRLSAQDKNRNKTNSLSKELTFIKTVKGTQKARHKTNLLVKCSSQLPFVTESITSCLAANTSVLTVFYTNYPKKEMVISNEDEKAAA